MLTLGCLFFVIAFVMFYIHTKNIASVMARVYKKSGVAPFRIGIVALIIGVILVTI